MITFFIKRYITIKVEEKFFLVNPSSQKGSTFVVATIMGILVIGGLGLSISKANNDKTNIITDKQTKQVLAVAETGVTKIKDLFLKEPRLAMVKDNNQWTDIINSGKDQLHTKLDEVAQIPAIHRESNCNMIKGTFSSNSDILDEEEIITKLQGEVIKVPSQNLNITQGVNDWVSLESNNQYRLVSYDYNRDTQKAVLVVQGKSENITKSIAQVKVNFDILKEKEKIPTLWITDEGNYFGNNQISGNIKIYSPTCKTLEKMGNNNKPLLNSDNIINGGKIDISKESIPETPQKPDDSNVNIVTDINQSTIFPLNIMDKKDSDGYYHYLVPSLTLKDNQTLAIASNKKVVLYLQSDFNMSDNSEIIIPDTSNLQIYGNTYDLVNLTSKYGCPENITLCETNKVLISGKIPSSNIFIHAPNAIVKMRTNSNNNLTFKGSIWAKSWDASDINNLVINNYGNDRDYLSSKNFIPKSIYKIQNISTWTTENMN